MSVDKIVSTYDYHDEKEVFGYSYLAPAVIKILKDCTHLRILELGCGNGYFCETLSGMGHEVVGVDASDTGIEIAQKRHSGARFIKSNIYDLMNSQALAGEDFDIVIAIEVIEHLQYPRELLKCANRFLKKGGRLIVSTPYHGYFKNLVLSICNAWDNHFKVSWDVGHIRFFSIPTLKKIYEEEGFKNIVFRFSGRFAPLWKSMICIGEK